MKDMRLRDFTKTDGLLAVIFLLIVGMAALCAATLWTIEHYMDITPADWPYPGSFWDRANDFTCLLILLPSGPICRLALWQIFFLVPACITVRERSWWVAFLYAGSITMPTHIASQYRGDLYGHLAYLLILLIAFPAAIFTWTSRVTQAWEKMLMRAILTAIWLIFLTADIMLGIAFHADDCKPGLVSPIAGQEKPL